MQFESHLGHDVFPRQRGFCFDVCTKLVVVALTAGARAVAWPPLWPIQVCGLVGSSPWLVGLPPAVGGVLQFLVPVLSCGPGVAYTHSWTGGAGTT